MRLERVVVVESAARLWIRDSGLVVERPTATNRVALADFAAVVIDTPEVTVTGGVLRALSTQGIPLIATDGQHHVTDRHIGATP